MHLLKLRKKIILFIPIITPNEVYIIDIILCSEEIENSIPKLRFYFNESRNELYGVFGVIIGIIYLLFISFYKVLEICLFINIKINKSTSYKSVLK